MGRTLTETVNGRTTTYTYDALGRRISRRTPSGITSTWTYEATGHPHTLTGTGSQLRFAYDAAHRETRAHDEKRKLPWRCTHGRHLPSGCPPHPLLMHLGPRPQHRSRPHEP
ncbi:hypothetical protein AB0K99_01835 [Streptomyces werraensis]